MVCYSRICLRTSEDLLGFVFSIGGGHIPSGNFLFTKGECFEK